jgi:serine/threonine protein kinase
LLLGRWERLGPLATGGMAHLHEGLDHAVSPSRRVVLKWARPNDPGFAAALDREFEHARDLVHPNLVKYLDRGRDGAGAVFLVIEHGGRSLRERLDERPRPRLRDLLDVLRQVASACDYLRDERRLAHLDVTPKNIVIDDDGVARVIDLGIARRLGPHGELRGPREFGHQMYEAPEVTRGRGRHADQYCLAMVALAIEIGPDDLAARLTDETPAAIAEGRFFPPLERALCPDASRRFPSATAFVDALAESVHKGRFVGWLSRLLR